MNGEIDGRTRAALTTLVCKLRVTVITQNMLYNLVGSSFAVCKINAKTSLNPICNFQVSVVAQQNFIIHQEKARYTKLIKS